MLRGVGTHGKEGGHVEVDSHTNVGGTVNSREQMMRELEDMGKCVVEKTECWHCRVANEPEYGRARWRPCGKRHAK